MDQEIAKLKVVASVLSKNSLDPELVEAFHTLCACISALEGYSASFGLTDLEYKKYSKKYNKCKDHLEYFRKLISRTLDLLPDKSSDSCPMNSIVLRATKYELSRAVSLAEDEDKKVIISATTTFMLKEAILNSVAS